MLDSFQLVDEINFQAVVIESQGIDACDAFLTDQTNPSNPVPLTRFITTTSAARRDMRYTAAEREQTAVSPSGFMAEFTIRYDVIHQTNAGEIQVNKDEYL